jgi:transposase-like protein
LVVEQQQSGQSVAVFCRERGVKSGQFFAWKRKLREAETAQFVAVEVAEVKRPSSAVHSGGIEVRLGRGRSIVVEPGFDAHHLRALLAVLEAEA